MMIDLGTIKQGERGTLAIRWEFPDALSYPASIVGATITAVAQNMDTGDVTAVSGTLTATAAAAATWALSDGDSGTAGTYLVTFRADVSGTPTYTLNGVLVVEENPAVTAMQNGALVGLSSAEAAWVTAGKAAVADGADLVDANDLGTAAYAATGDFDAAGSAAAAQAASQPRDADAIVNNAAIFNATGSAVDGGSYYAMMDTTNVIRAGEYRTRPRTTQALISFVFDDGTMTDYTLMLPLFQLKGIVGTSAIITDYAAGAGGAGYMTWTEIGALAAAGWEIASHGKTHAYFTTFTAAQLRAELAGAQADFSAQGLTVRNLVYPYHDSNESVRAIAREYYRSARGQAGFTGTAQLNLNLLETYNLRSVEIDDHTALASYKSAVDLAVSNSLWLIFYAHGTDANDVTAIGELIDYIQAKPVDIVTIDAALDILGNDIDLSEFVAIRGNEARIKKISGNVGFGVTPESAVDVNGTLISRGTIRSNYDFGGTTNKLIESRYYTWTQPKFDILGDGKIEWGAGSAAAVDVNLYRLSANNLKTDNNLTVAGNLTVAIGLITNMRANTNAFPANKVNIAPAGTAVLTINFSTTYPTGFARVYCTVYYSSSTNLQSHLTYQLLTVETAATGGGGIAIQQLHNDSAGNFLVQTTDFVVTRPSNGRIVITYTNSNPAGNNNIYFFVEGVSISDVSIA